MLPLSIERLSLERKQSFDRALIRSVASSSEMNCVRRHRSAIRSGRLVAACALARLLTWAISDVPDDDPINIASNPTMPEPTTCADALAIVRRYVVGLSPEAREVLEGGRGENSKLGDVRLAKAQFKPIATPQIARAFKKGFLPADGLAESDGHGFSEVFGNQVIGGPALTNANYFRAVFVDTRRQQ